MNNYLTVSTSSYGVVVALDIVFTSDNIKQIKKHHQKSTQTRKEKSLQMKRDVGMACQKMTQTREDGYKSEGKYTKPHPCIFLTLKCNCSVKRCRGDKALYSYLHFYILPCLCYFLSCHPYISFHFFLMIFLFLLLFIPLFPGTFRMTFSDWLLP